MDLDFLVCITAHFGIDMKNFEIRRTLEHSMYLHDLVGNVEAETPEHALEAWYIQSPWYWGKVNFVKKIVEGKQVYIEETGSQSRIYYCC